MEDATTSVDAPVWGVALSERVRYCQHIMKRLLPILVIVLLLASCTSAVPPVAAPTPSRSSTADSAAYVESIKTLWGDCLASLKITDTLTYKPNSAGKVPLGYVKVSDLSWSIARSDTGKIVNSPTNATTKDKLATVGC
ncbi:hypothetical protein ABIB56_000776 [Glaciihabitans sp. UYNi722]